MYNDKTFLVFSCNPIESTIIDKKRGLILRLKHGFFEDITEECRKMFNRCKKNKRLGVNWYEVLIKKQEYLNSALIYQDEIIIFTDNQSLFDEKLIELQYNQIRTMLNMNMDTKSKFINNKQYYLYCHSNKQEIK